MSSDLLKRARDGDVKVCVVGMGYVGLPLALAFAKAGISTVGLDVSEKRIGELDNNVDTSGENSEKELKEGQSTGNIEYSTDMSRIKESDFIILALPTPVDDNNEPDLSFIKSAGKAVGQNLKEGSVVVLESTVYPGVTEDILLPAILSETTLTCPAGFKIGYSPERVNFGDKEHTLESVVKIVSGIDKDALDAVEALYSHIVKAGLFRAKNIKAAEAAKVTENIQRDLNIALMNELSMIFTKMGIRTRDVLEAAGTKWNFHKYFPGLVGGHCIPVDPYYLVHKTKELGHYPNVILAGRKINNMMPQFVADRLIDALGEGKNVLVLGLTFKKNVKDTRTSTVKGLIDRLKEKGISVSGFDPLLDKGTVENGFDVSFEDIENSDKKFDAVVLATPHDKLVSLGIEKIASLAKAGGILLDVYSVFSREKAKDAGLEYLEL